MKKYQHWFYIKLDIELDIGMTISVKSFSRIFFFLREKNIKNFRELFTFLFTNDNRMKTSHPIKTIYKIHSKTFLVISIYNEARIMCNTYFISTSVIITTCNRLSYTNIIIESVKHNVQWSIVLYAVQNRIRQFQRKQLHG